MHSSRKFLKIGLEDVTGSVTTNRRTLYVYGFLILAALVLASVAIGYAITDFNKITACSSSLSCTPTDVCTPVACINNQCVNLQRSAGCCVSGACTGVTPADYSFNIIEANTILGQDTATVSVSNVSIATGTITALSATLDAAANQLTLGASPNTMTITSVTPSLGTFTIAAPRAGTHFVALFAHTSGAGSPNNNTASETDLLAGATCIPACATMDGHFGYQIPAYVMAGGKYLRLTMAGLYSTNGGTATITVQIRATQTNGTISVIPGPGVASGTFASAAGPNAWSTSILVWAPTNTTMSATGVVSLGGQNVAATTAALPSIAGTVAGVSVDYTNTLTLAPTWQFSSAGSTTSEFQLTTSTLELMN